METYRSSRLAQVAVVALLAAGVTLSVGGALGFNRWDTAFYDLWTNVAGRRATPEHVAVVSIDRETLAAHRDEPLVSWGPYYGRAVEVLREVGARLVVIDLDLGIGVEEWLARMEIPGSDLSRTWDRSLREAVSHGDVLLVGELQEGEGQFVLPRLDLLYSLPDMPGHVGLAHLVVDGDGVVRRFLPSLPPELEPVRLTVGMLAAVRVLGLDPEATAWNVGAVTLEAGERTWPIRWAGPPGTVPAVSFQRLLAEGAAADPAVQALAGRVVIIGSDHVGFHDVHLTPYASARVGGARQHMSGPEIQANIIETVLSGQIPRRVPGAVGWGLAAVFTLLAAWAVVRLPMLAAAGTGLALIAAAAAASWLAFRADWRLGVGATHLGVTAAWVLGQALRLTGEQRRRRELARVFGRYVSPEVVERLASSGRAPVLGGETVGLTVMFMDIRSFTTLSETLGAQEVVGMLNAFFSRAVQPILAEGGMVNSYLGDGLMALFGSPVALPDHAARAMRAALAIQTEAKAFQAWVDAHLPGRSLPPFAVGIGIHTGEAVTGNIGSQQRMQFTAIGDTVNTAARVEGETKRLGIGIGVTQSAVEAARAHGITPTLGVRDEAVVKGRAAPVVIHELRGLEQSTVGAGLAEAL